MSRDTEYSVIISPLLSNKIDEMFNKMSSNLEEIKSSIHLMSIRVFDLEKKVKNIEVAHANFELISKDFWRSSETN